MLLRIFCVAFIITWFYSIIICHLSLLGFHFLIWKMMKINSKFSLNSKLYVSNGKLHADSCILRTQSVIQPCHLIQKKSLFSKVNASQVLRKWQSGIFECSSLSESWLIICELWLLDQWLLFQQKILWKSNFSVIVWHILTRSDTVTRHIGNDIQHLLFYWINTEYKTL